METVLQIIGSAGFAALVSAVVSVIATSITRAQDRKEREIEKQERAAEREKEKGDVMKQAICLILLRNLQSFAADLLEKEAVEQRDLEQFDEMYNTYKALDGDGFADRWRADVYKKPIHL